MTVQQQAYALIDNMSDEGVKYVIELIQNLKLSVFKDESMDGYIDVSKRIGIGKGIIDVPEDFDKWNEEISDLLEGVND